MKRALRAREFPKPSYRVGASVGFQKTGWAWPAKLPADWTKARLKNLARSNLQVLPEDTPVDAQIQYVDIGSVTSDGVVAQKELLTFGAAPSRARRIVRTDDVIISTVRTYLRAIAHIDRADENLVASTGFSVLTAKQGVRPRFLYYLLRSHEFIERVVAFSDGISYPAIAPALLDAMPAWCPPTESEQEIICEFLDAETRKIDSLVSSKHQLMELLDEKQEAFVAEQVVGGAASRRPSLELPWLESIPIGWSVRQGKRLFSEIDERSTTGEEVLLSLRMNSGLVPHDEVSEKPIPSADLVGYKICNAGDIVVNRMRASSGLVAVAHQRGIVSPDYAVIRMFPGQSPGYFSMLFGTRLMQAVFRSESRGLGTGSSGFLRLHAEDLLAMKFPVPSFEEQKAIVSSITSETGRLETLHKAEQRAIELLRERRGALISAVVTGAVRLSAK